MTRLFAFFSLVSLLFFGSGTTEDNSLENLIASLDTFNKDFPQEKVYLHFDKPYYYTGEEMWFQAYLVAGPSHVPSPFSSNLYVEILDNKGSIHKRINLLIENGVAKGDFKIPKSFESGNYTLRAYTNWMRNFDHEFFFQKQISVIKATDGNLDLVNNQSDLQISFYPEGGDLIENVLSRIAIKVSSEKSLGNDKTVNIHTQEGLLIETLVTNEDGIGIFNLKPENEKGYYGIIEGNSNRFELPKALESGFTIEVDNVSNNEFIQLRLSTTNENKEKRKVYVIAQTRGVISFASQLEFSSSLANLKIPKKDLISGVVQITIFNENWQPESERLIFHNAQDNLKIGISLDKQDYLTRDSTVLKFKVTDQNNQPIQGQFSLSVIDSAQIDGSLFYENILSNLLLTSDLKGHITNPLRFFKDGIDMKAELDKIMMTHGWRRFAWKDLLSNNYPEIGHGVEQGISLQGTLLTSKKGKPIEKGKVSLVGSFRGAPSFASVESLNGGFFVLGGLQYYEEEENFLKGVGKKGKKNGFVMLDSTAKTYPDFIGSSIPLKGFNEEIIEDHIEKSIERQYIKSLYEFDDDVQDLGEFVVEGVADADRRKKSAEYQLLDFDKIAGQVKYKSPFQAIKNIVPNINVDGIGANTKVSLSYGTRTIRSADKDPVILLDGARVTMEYVNSLPAHVIKKVEVHKGTIELLELGEGERLQSGGGIIEFTSRNSEEQAAYFKLIGDKSVMTLPGGYYKPSEYFSPRYFPEKPEHIIPDNRVLIHWAPLISTDVNGEAALNFYNADLPTTVAIKIEGISKDGQIGIGQYAYKVLKR